MSRMDQFYARYLPWLVAGPPVVLVTALLAKISLGYDGTCQSGASVVACGFRDYLVLNWSPSDPGNLAAYVLTALMIAAWLAVWIPVLTMRRR